MGSREKAIVDLERALALAPTNAEVAKVLEGARNDPLAFQAKGQVPDTTKV